MQKHLQPTNLTAAVALAWRLLDMYQYTHLKFEISLAGMKVLWSSSPAMGTVTPLLTRFCWHCYPEDPFLPCLFKSGPCDSGKIFKDYITCVTYFTQAVENDTVGKLERCRKGSFISLNAESDSLCPDSVILFIQSSEIRLFHFNWS